jgi:hypothetical protein
MMSYSEPQAAGDTPPQAFIERQRMGVLASGSQHLSERHSMKGSGLMDSLAVLFAKGHQIAPYRNPS